MFTRLSMAVLALLTCLWAALIFDFGNIVHHLGELLQTLDAD